MNKTISHDKYDINVKISRYYLLLCKKHDILSIFLVRRIILRTTLHFIYCKKVLLDQKFNWFVICIKMDNAKNVLSLHSTHLFVLEVFLTGLSYRVKRLNARTFEGNVTMLVTFLLHNVWSKHACDFVVTITLRGQFHKCVPFLSL